MFADVSIGHRESYVHSDEPGRIKSDARSPISGSGRNRLGNGRVLAQPDGMSGGIEIWVAAVLRELTLFAAIGFLIGNVDELVVDLLWIGRTIRRRFVVPPGRRVDSASLAPAARPGRLAVFVPAWDEAAVIGAMLDMTLDRFGAADCRLYVGCYPNDPATIAAVAVRAARDGRVRPVVCGRPGPTTKADCLNHLWRALLADEAADGVRAKAVVLHDAEDVVHGAEPAIFDRLIERFDLVQLPVLPLIDRRSRWVSGHYADAFSEAHGKTLVVREAIGAAMPSAGVGCAISRVMLGRIADAAGGAPFDPASLTEDYEIGLKVRALGGRGIFVRMPARGDRAVVAIREYFPATFDAAVKQKARWMAGIALDGWDRMGWQGGVAERWMRLRDRRAPLAMIVLAGGYAAMALWAAAWAAGMAMPAVTGAWATLLWANLLLVGWRAAVRMAFVTHAYGWREGVRAVPRMVIGNIVDMAAARRGIGLYLRGRRDGGMRWEKTAHRFPDPTPAA